MCVCVKMGKSGRGGGLRVVRLRVSAAYPVRESLSSGRRAMAVRSVPAEVGWRERLDFRSLRFHSEIGEPEIFEEK